MKSIINSTIGTFISYIKYQNLNKGEFWLPEIGLFPSNPNLFLRPLDGNFTFLELHFRISSTNSNV